MRSFMFFACEQRYWKYEIKEEICVSHVAHVGVHSSSRNSLGNVCRA